MRRCSARCRWFWCSCCAGTAETYKGIPGWCSCNPNSCQPIYNYDLVHWNCALNLGPRRSCLRHRVHRSDASPRITVQVSTFTYFHESATGRWKCWVNGNCGQINFKNGGNCGFDSRSEPGFYCRVAENYTIYILRRSDESVHEHIYYIGSWRNNHAVLRRVYHLWHSVNLRTRGCCRGESRLGIRTQDVVCVENEEEEKRAHATYGTDCNHDSAVSLKEKCLVGRMVDGFIRSTTELRDALRRSILVALHEYATVPLSFLVHDDFISNVVWGSLQVRFDVIGSTAGLQIGWCLCFLFVIVLAVLFQRQKLVDYFQNIAHNHNPQPTAHSPLSVLGNVCGVWCVCESVCVGCGVRESTVKLITIPNTTCLLPISDNFRLPSDITAAFV